MRVIGYTSLGTVLIEVTTAEAKRLLADTLLPEIVAPATIFDPVPPAPAIPAPCIRDVIQLVGNDLLGERIRCAMINAFGDKPVTWLLDELQRIRDRQYKFGQSLAILCANWPVPPDIDEELDTPLLLRVRNIGPISIERMMAVFLDNETGVDTVGEDAP